MKKSLSALLLLGCVAVRAASAAVDAAFVDTQLGWIFPQRLASLPYESFTQYEADELGYELVYRQGGAFSAKLTVCTLGREPIPDGCKTDAVTAVLKDADVLLTEKQERGECVQLRKRGSAIVPASGKIQFAQAVYEYAGAVTNASGQPDRKMTAYYVTGISNRFVRLQLTFDAAENRTAHTLADELVAQVAALIGKTADRTELVLGACAVLRFDPAGYGGRSAAKYLIDFTKSAEQLSINIYPHLFPWQDESRKIGNVELLTTGYFAGVLEYMLSNRVSEGGEVEGFAFMLDIYQTLRAREQIEAMPKLDEWAQQPDRKALFDKLLTE